jgi:xanthine dehydrogenase molybdenum-binding subunit
MIMTTTENRPTEYKVIGTRPIRHDGVDKVTGRAGYGADINLHGMLYGKVLRSPHAHARITYVDVSKAEAHPGVIAVISGKDMPQVTGSVSIAGGEGGAINLQYYRNLVLASEKVLFKGHPVAVVAAINAHVAEEALSLIDVGYEVLPHVLTAPEAMQDDAPLILEDLSTKSMGQNTGKVSNIAAHEKYVLGDVEKGFQEAEVVIEHEFTTSTVHQGYIEPQNATVLWNADGEVTVWTSSQGPFYVRRATAALLGLQESQVRVIPMEIGGGFGGKIICYLEVPAAILSRKTGHPIKLVMTRAEVLEATGPTSGSHMRVKIGTTREGKLTAAEATLAFEAGALPGSPVGGAARCMFSQYNIGNINIDTYDVIVNKPKTGAYRAPGATHGSFAAETIIDEICSTIGMDPLEFRLKNASKEGDRRSDGVVHGRIGNVETLQGAMNSSHWNTPLEGRWRGRGVASGYWGNAGLESSATLSVNADGTVNQVTGSVDIGGSRVATAMHAAEVLGIRAQDVHPVVGDTTTIGYTAVTGGSRTTFATGWATYEAAHDVLLKMKERAALLWETTSAHVEFSEGIFWNTSNVDQKLQFKELAERLMDTGGPIIGTASVSPKGVGASFATHIVDVEVDPETGKVDILRYTTVTDVGKAIHPSYVEGQIQGGAVQGIGWALNEEYNYDSLGRMANNSLLDYRMPTALDLPMIDTILIEVPNPGHPYGARGVGEIPLVPPVAAIANAIHDAVRVRMHHTPMSPRHVLEALWQENSQK